MPFDPRPRVLCLDDDADTCEMLTVLMFTYGIDGICAQSTAEAWLEIEKKTFDLYVLDCWLPDSDGFEFCRQVRESDASTPILFYSGAAYDSDRQKGIAAGANDYVVKPDIESLIKKMVDLIAQTNAAPFTSSRRSRPHHQPDQLVLATSA